MARHETLVLCPTVDAFERAAAAAVAPDAPIPVLDGPEPAIDRLPPVIGRRREDPDAAAGASATRGPVAGDPASGGDPRRPVIAIGRPVAVAAARLLARRTGRELAVAADAEAVLAEVDRRLAAGPLASLTVVLPCWASDGAPDPSAYREVLDGLRDRHGALARVPWGFLAGADPRTLAFAVAKALLAPTLDAARAGDPAGVFSILDKQGPPSPLPRFTGPEMAASLQLIDPDHVADRSALGVVERPWRLLICKGHGRSYCALDGFLCGARKPRTPASATIGADHGACVLGMTCVHESYPRIDPRRYDVWLLMLDCCGSGNGSTQPWDAGWPSVAFLALQGPAAAVISSDGVTMNRAGDYVDSLWALSVSATLGEAMMRINAQRPDAAAEFPYLLFGDPETPVDPRLSEAWCQPARVTAQGPVGEAGYRVEAVADPGTATYRKLTLPVAAFGDDPAAATWFLEVQGGAERVIGEKLFRSPDGATLWFGFAGAPTESRRLTLERQPSPAFPTGLLEVAVDVPVRLRRWTRDLERYRPAVEQSAERLIKVARLIDHTAGKLVQGAPGQLSVTASASVADWIAAQAAAVDGVATAMGWGGLWPFRLWSVHDFRTERIDRTCPYCGASRILLRSYRSFPLGTRHQWECMRCDLILDWPEDPDGDRPDLAIDVPGDLHPGQTIQATITIDNRHGRSDAFGAAIVLLDGRNHGVRWPAGPVAVEVAAGETETITRPLTLPDTPKIPHLYRIRGLTLINAQWFLLSRQCFVWPAAGSADGAGARAGAATSPAP